MASNRLDLFCGKLVRFACPCEDRAAEEARWAESMGYLRRVDSDVAVPRPEGFFRERLKAQGTSGPHTYEFSVVSQADGEVIGFAAVHGIEWNNRAGLIALGIGSNEHRGRGYGTEVLRLLLDYAFGELNLDRVGLDVMDYNAEAIRLYRRAGFVEEGRLRGAVRRDGQVFDRIVMGLRREEWASTTGGE